MPIFAPNIGDHSDYDDFVHGCFKQFDSFLTIIFSFFLVVFCQGIFAFVPQNMSEVLKFSSLGVVHYFQFFLPVKPHFVGFEFVYTFG